MFGPSSFLRALESCVDTSPASIALEWLDDEGRLTVTRSYGELGARIGMLSAWLAGPDLGLEPGDRLLLAYPPGLDFIEAFIACLAAGLVAVPVFAPEGEAATRRYASIRQDSGAAATLTTVDQLRSIRRASSPPELQEAVTQSHWHTTDDITAAAGPDSNTSFRLGHRLTSPDRLAFLQYTSGTTGDPKGVAVTHANLDHNLRLISAAGLANANVSPREGVCVSWLPHGHDMGLIGSRLCALYIGASSITMSPYAFLREPSLWMKVCARERATHTQAPDFALELCARRWRHGQDSLDDDLTCLTSIIVGAELVREATLDRFMATFGPMGLSRRAICPSYGLAEHTLLAATTHLRHDDGWSVSADRTGCGLVADCADVDVRIVTPDGVECASGDIGEIWIDSPSKAQGYWGKPELSEQQFHASLAGAARTDRGYLRTGDLGFIDDRGELYVTGRAKELIVVRGRNLHPHDIEQSILQALPDQFRTGSVVAFSVDRDGAEELAITVSPKDQSAEAAAPVARAIAAVVTRRHGVAPAAVVTSPPGSLPRTTSGKVQRSKLAQRLLDGAIAATYIYRPDGAVASGEDDLSDTEERLRNLWSSVLDRAHGQISRHSEFDQLGGDSVATVRLAHLVRDEFGLDESVFDERRIYDNPCLHDMARQIELREPLPSSALDAADCQSELRMATAMLTRIGVTSADLAGRSVRGITGSGGHVLITGATGFFGAYLISELLNRRPDVRVTCVVRPDHRNRSPLARVERALSSYGLWDTSYTQRIAALHADLGAPYLGLDRRSWNDVADRVDEVYHCAAQVDWVRPYDQLRPANVHGTLEVLRLACAGESLRPVHLMSTLGVVSEQFLLERKVAAEQDDIEPIGFDTDYFASKWISDSLAGEAARRGVPVLRYRFDELSGDTTHGILNVKGICARLIQGVAHLGSAPDIDVNYMLLPVDVVAEAIVQIGSKAREDSSLYGQAFHLLAWNFSPLSRLWEMLRSIGYSLEERPFSQWRDLLAESDPANALYPMLPYIRRVHMDRWVAAKAKGTRFGVENVIRALDGEVLDRTVGFSTELALWKTIDHLLTRGFLTPPTHVQRQVITMSPDDAVSDDELAAAVRTLYTERWPRRWHRPDLEVVVHRSGVTDARSSRTPVPDRSDPGSAHLVATVGVQPDASRIRIVFEWPEVDPRSSTAIDAGLAQTADDEWASGADALDWIAAPAVSTGSVSPLRRELEPTVVESISRLAAANGVDRATVLLAAFGVYLSRCDWQSQKVTVAASLPRLPQYQWQTFGREFAAYVASAQPRSITLPRRFGAPLSQHIQQVTGLLGVSDAGCAPAAFAFTATETLPGDPRWSPDTDLAGTRGGASLALDVALSDSGIELTWNSYHGELFDEGLVRRSAAGFESLLAAVAKDASLPVGALPMMSEGELEQVVSGFNRSDDAHVSAVASSRCLHELVWEQAQRTPEAVAVITGDAGMSFAELEESARELAGVLAARGVGPESRVGLLIGRCNEAVVGMLAAMQAGAAYVPLDPDIPMSRLAFMAKDAGCSVVLSVAATAGLLQSPQWDVDVPVVRVDRRAGWPVPSAVQGGVEPRNAMYVLYTSGTTGEPKGVVVEHRNVVNMLRDKSFDQLVVGQGNRWLQSCSLGFCLHVLMWHPLTRGGSVRMAEDLTERIPDDVGAVSIALSALEAIDLPANVEAVYIAGEKRTARAVAQIGVRRLYDAYGATETIVCVGGFVDADSGDLVGRPIANSQVYVLDGQRNPVPIGVRGEIYLAGAGVAREYVRNPELTAQRFLDNPFRLGRMYRTGDLGCWLPSGELRILGRIDDQVKVHGCRVELKEVQAALHDGDEGVVSAHAAVRGDNLVAWVTPTDVDTTAITRRLRATKPRYLVPDRITAVDAFPTLPSGKVDTKQLPDLQPRRVKPSPRKPQTDLQKQLAAIWQSVLGSDSIDMADDFFDIGGSSLMAVRVSGLARRAGIDLSVTDVIQAPVFEDLATLAAGGACTSEVVNLARTESARPAALFIPGVGLGLGPLRPLARRLRAPVYGLQFGSRTPAASIEQMAAHFRTRIARAVPGGASMICGYSFGGVVAWELARQLAEHGSPVSQLVLIEPMSPIQSSHIGRIVRRPAVSGVAAKIADMRRGGAITAAGVGRILTSEFPDSPELVAPVGLGELVSIIQLFDPLTSVPNEYVAAISAALDQIAIAGRYLWPSVEVDSVLPRITVIHARDRSDDCQAALRTFQELAPGCEVDSHVVDGTHTGILLGAGAQSLAEILRMVEADAPAPHAVRVGA